MLWHLQIDPAPGRDDRAGRQVVADAAELGLPGPWAVAASRGFLVEGGLEPRRPRPRRRGRPRRPGRRDVRDPAGATRPSTADGTIVHVLPKPGVTDPEAESALALLRDLGYRRRRASGRSGRIASRGRRRRCRG